MRAKTKVWIMFGVFFTLLGLVLFSAGMSLNGWDFTKLTTEKHETNTYEIKENFKNVSIHADTADVSLVLTEEEVCKVVCHEPVKEKHAVAVQNETLSVTATDTRKWFDKITFMSFDSPCLEIYLPKTVYEELVIELSTGDILIPENFTFRNIEITASTGEINLDGTKAGSIELSVSTGRINVKNVVCDGKIQVGVSTGKTELTSICCKEFTSVGTTGDISFVHTIVDDKLSVERSTGDVLFDQSDAGEISVETSTGYVKGTLLSEKVFFTESDTGNINVPKTVTGGKCEIKTDTGNIEIEIAE